MSGGQLRSVIGAVLVIAFVYAFAGSPPKLPNDRPRLMKALMLTVAGHCALSWTALAWSLMVADQSRAVWFAAWATAASLLMAWVWRGIDIDGNDGGSGDDDDDDQPQGPDGPPGPDDKPAREARIDWDQFEHEFSEHIKRQKRPRERAEV